MTAITVTEVSSEDMPMNRLAGTGKRRIKIYVRGTVLAGGSGTLDLATYVPTLGNIEGVLFVTDDDVAQVPTDVTWSGTTITVADAGAAELGIIGSLT